MKKKQNKRTENKLWIRHLCRYQRKLLENVLNFHFPLTRSTDQIMDEGSAIIK